MIKIIHIVYILTAIIIGLTVLLVCLSLKQAYNSSIIGAAATILGTLIASDLSLFIERTRRINKHIRDHLYEIKEKCLVPLKLNIEQLGSDSGYLFVSEQTLFITPKEVEDYLSLPIHPWDKSEGGVDFRLFIGPNLNAGTKIVDKALYEDLKKHGLTEVVTATNKLRNIYSKSMKSHFLKYKELYNKVTTHDGFKKLVANLGDKVALQATFFTLFDIDKGHWPNIYRMAQGSMNEIGKITLQIKKTKEYNDFNKIEDKINRAKKDAIDKINNGLDLFALRETNCRYIMQLDF